MSTYFASCYSVLIVVDYTSSRLRNQYVDAVYACFTSSAVQTLYMSTSSDADVDFAATLMQHTDLGVDAYITVVADVSAFMRIKRAVQDESTQRAHDKRFLYLCFDQQSVDELMDTQDILKSTMCLNFRSDSPFKQDVGFSLPEPFSCRAIRRI